MYLDRKDLPPQLRSLGNRIKVVLTPTVVMPADAGTWSGGTREVYSALELATGSVVSITDTFSAPWDASRRNREITLKPGFAILVTGSFCGKPAVPYLYCHPESAALALPPPPAPLSTADKIVLGAACGLKSAYRAEHYRRAGLADHQVAESKARLQGLGYLDSRGAVTTQGRNARPQI